MKTRLRRLGVIALFTVSPLFADTVFTDALNDSVDTATATAGITFVQELVENTLSPSFATYSGLAILVTGFFLGRKWLRRTA